MKTKQQIKDDLKQIKYYYSRKAEFESSAKRIIASSVTELVDKYNQAIHPAPALLYDIYICLYTENCSQACVAEDLNFSPEYISRLNNRLISYLENEFAKE